MFVLYLRENGILDESEMTANALVALALLIAVSDPKQKNLHMRLALNLLAKKGEGNG